MHGTGLLLGPGTAVFMLVVGIIAAVGQARRGLDVQPTEALWAEQPYTHFVARDCITGSRWSYC